MPCPVMSVNYHHQPAVIQKQSVLIGYEVSQEGVNTCCACQLNRCKVFPQQAANAVPPLLLLLHALQQHSARNPLFLKMYDAHIVAGALRLAY